MADRDADLAVAIDGPMGSGKSTVAREVARRLGFRYVDTGAMYRAVAAAAIRRGIVLSDADGLSRLARAATMDFAPRAGEPVRVLVAGDDMTASLRSIEVNRVVALVAKVPEVRQALGAIQRRLGESGRVVMEGRDIGSVILPRARIKVFLTASIDARARRRQAELAAGSTAMALDDVRQIIEADDRMASSRETAPLLVAPGAVVIDSTALTVDEVVDEILTLVERARGI